MNLAQKLDRPPITLEAVPSSGATPLKANPPIDFRQLLRRTSAPQPLPAPVKDTEPSGKPASDVALGLLGEVSTAMTALMARCQELEGSLDATKAQAARDVETAQETAREWEQIAQAMKVQIEQMEAGMAGLKQRLDGAEERATSIQAMAEKSQHAAAEAECLASLFQEKVISSFGLGSAGHSILESVRNRTAMMRTA